MEKEQIVASNVYCSTGYVLRILHALIIIALCFHYTSAPVFGSVPARYGTDGWDRAKERLRLNGTNFSSPPALHMKKGEIIFSLFEDSRGDILIGTNMGTLYRCRKNGTVVTLRTPLDTAITAIAEDRNGELWLGTGGKGVLRVKQEKGKIEFKHFTGRDGLAHNYICSISLDSHSNLWFGTLDGVSRYNGVDFSSYTPGDIEDRGSENETIPPDFIKNGKVDESLFAFQPRQPEYYFEVAIGFIFIILLIAFYLFARKRSHEEITQQYKNTNKNDNERNDDETNILLNCVFEDQCVKKLIYLMEVEKFYRQADISLQSLSNKLSITPHQLSRLLNQRLGRGFSDFVNTYRIEEARRILRDPIAEGRKIISIAFAVGFNTKVAFNSSFKKYTGMTPSQYKKLKKL